MDEAFENEIIDSMDRDLEPDEDDGTECAPSVPCCLHGRLNCFDCREDPL